MAWELHQRCIPRELSLFGLSCRFREDLMGKAIFIRLALDLIGPEAFSQWVFVQIITGNCVILWLPEMVDNSWD